MKKTGLILLLNLLILVAAAQIGERKIVSIWIEYQSSFAMLPEYYDIKLSERTVDYVSPITKIPDGNEIRESKKFKKKRWNELISLIDKIKFDTINSSSEHGIDGAWFYLNILYSNSVLKKCEIWSGNAPEALIKLHTELKKNKK